MIATALFRRLEVEFDSDRAVIRPQDFGSNKGILQVRSQSCGKEEVVDTPAHIPTSGARHRAPPGIVSAAFFELAEGVYKSRFEEGTKTFAFFDRETMVTDVCFRVRQVDFRVCHVEVTAEDHRFLLLQFFEVREEIDVPFLTVGQSGQFALGIGDIHIDQEEVGILRRDGSALLIVFADTDTERDLGGAFFSKDRGARVALLLGWIPVRGIIRRPEGFDLVGFRFGFLQAEDVRRFFLEVF